jgi:hypothetical protein
MSIRLVATELIYCCSSRTGAISHSVINSTSIAVVTALVALAVSIILPLYLDSRQSPRVSVRVSRLVHFDSEMNATDYYVVSAINHGRSQVQINQVNISYIKRGWDCIEVFLPFLDFERSPSFPHTLGPYSDTAFYITQRSIGNSLNDLKACRIYGSLNLSSGYRAVSRRGLVPKVSQRLPKRYPRLRRLRLIIFGKERSRWR